MKSIKVQADGHNGPINFEVDVHGNYLDDIKVTNHSETPGIFKQVFGNLRKNIIDNQSFEVDAISGATVMSQAILNSGDQAVKNAGVQLQNKTENNVREDKEVDADVVVIGGGGAGLLAACKMLAAGKRVVLLEKNGYLGGATILNGSNVTATNSKTAKRIFGDDAKSDSAHRLAEDVANECLETNDVELTKLMSENIGPAIDFISDFAALDYRKAQTQTPEHSVERQIELPSSSSFEFIQKVSDAFQKKGGQIYLDARVEELIIKDKEVKGVKAQRRSGSLTVNAPALILATGGYGANQAMRGEESQGIDYYGPQTSTGDAFQFLKPLEPSTKNIGWYKIYPHGVEVEPGVAKLTTYASKKATDMGAVYVNSDGKRIVNESDVYTKLRNAVLKQKDKVAFLVMDKRTWEKFYELLVLHDFTEKEIAGYFDNDGQKTPIFVKGDLATAAKKAGIDSNNLQKTIDNYEKAVKDENDSEFGRDPEYLHTYEGNEYYIVEQRDRFATTLGGLTTEPTLNFKLKENKTVPNIWCVGELVGGANGHDSMPSMMNTWSFSSGYVAANNALKFLNNTNNKVITVGDLQLGVGRPKVAVPLTAKNEQELIAQAQKINSKNADLVEWRLDSFEDVQDEKALQKAAQKLRENLPDIPVLATFRTTDEGGNYSLSSENEYFEICQMVIHDHLGDLLDVELRHDEEKISSIVDQARQENVKIIMSNHDFEKTIPEEEIVQRLKAMENLGADIAKIALMPKSTADVLRVLTATNEAQQQMGIPLITMSMGDLGKISRVSGEVFGSCLTFGTVGKASAPGQIDSEMLHELLSALKLN